MASYEGVLICSDCLDHFCTGCAPKWGRCVLCENVLCWYCFRDAHRIHRGKCTHCAVPRKPDGDLKPKMSDARYWAEVNGRH